MLRGILAFVAFQCMVGTVVYRMNRDALSKATVELDRLRADHVRSQISCAPIYASPSGEFETVGPNGDAIRFDLPSLEESPLRNFLSPEKTTIFVMAFNATAYMGIVSFLYAVYLHQHNVKLMSIAGLRALNDTVLHAVGNLLTRVQYMAMKETDQGKASRLRAVSTCGSTLVNSNLTLTQLMESTERPNIFYGNLDTVGLIRHVIEGETSMMMWRTHMTLECKDSQVDMLRDLVVPELPMRLCIMDIVSNARKYAEGDIDLKVAIDEDLNTLIISSTNPGKLRGDRHIEPSRSADVMSWITDDEIPMPTGRGILAAEMRRAESSLEPLEARSISTRLRVEEILGSRAIPLFSTKGALDKTSHSRSFGMGILTLRIFTARFGRGGGMVEFVRDGEHYVHTWAELDLTPTEQPTSRCSL